MHPKCQKSPSSFVFLTSCIMPPPLYSGNRLSDLEKVSSVQLNQDKTCKNLAGCPSTSSLVGIIAYSMTPSKKPCFILGDVSESGYLYPVTLRLELRWLNTINSGQCKRNSAAVRRLFTVTILFFSRGCCFFSPLVILSVLALYWGEARILIHCRSGAEVAWRMRLFRVRGGKKKAVTMTEYEHMEMNPISPVRAGCFSPPLLSLARSLSHPAACLRP